ncbi:MAG TPA: YchJ family metal-binding protein [Oxalicibacterium sp.]|nr:YchJ family metal-binding protein [Oxalicibacterium sp.]
MTKKQPAATCPCGGADYAQCCKPFHDGAAAPTAEALMRSRYSAYVLGLTDYVHATWHADTRPVLGELAHDPMIKWLGLDVKKHAANGDEATVEFVARSRVGSRAHRLHEVSRFVREGGRWYYVDGVFPE